MKKNIDLIIKQLDKKIAGIFEGTEKVPLEAS